MLAAYYPAAFDVWGQPGTAKVSWQGDADGEWAAPPHLEVFSEGSGFHPYCDPNYGFNTWSHPYGQAHEDEAAEESALHSSVYTSSDWRPTDEADFSPSAAAPFDWNPFSSLPLPLRVPVGLEPWRLREMVSEEPVDEPVAPSPAASPHLLPLGMALAMAASLPTGFKGNKAEPQKVATVGSTAAAWLNGAAKIENGMQPNLSSLGERTVPLQDFNGLYRASVEAALSEVLASQLNGKSPLFAAPSAKTSVAAKVFAKQPPVAKFASPAGRISSPMTGGAFAAGILGAVSPAPAASSCAQANPSPILGLEAPAGMLIALSEVNGQACTRIEWRIDDLKGRLQACMGRPLVSPSFDACGPGLPSMRLMVFPDAREAVKTARSRERKGMYAAMVKKGPLYGSLKLKADGMERSTVLGFYLTCGGVRRGPFTYDFYRQAIHGCDDFGVDWLKQVEDPGGCLRVGVEILNSSLQVGLIGNM